MSLRINWPMGVFPAVALDAWQGWMAVREGDPRHPGALVVYVWDGTDLGLAQEWRRWSLKAESPAFPGLYVFEALLWLAYHDGARLQLRNLTAGTVRTFDALSNPTAFGAGCFAYCEPAQPYRVLKIDLRTGAITQPRLGAPTGLSRILDDGHVVTIDEDRQALNGATIPAFAYPLAVGEGPTGGVRWVAGGFTDLLWWPLDSFTPKCAVDGDRWAIATAGSGTVRVFCGSFEDLADASAPPGVPPKPPLPPPEPPPKPPIPPRPPDPPPPAPFLPPAARFGGHMDVYARLNGKYIGVDPSAPDTLYADRTKGDGWERIKLTAHENGRFDALLVAGNRQLSFGPNGLELRPAGAIGEWEQPFCTTQPDGTNLAYRVQDGTLAGPVLVLEAA